MNNATLSILDTVNATTTPGSDERIEAIAAVMYDAMGRCDDAAVVYLWQAIVGKTDVEYRGEGKARMQALAAECAQYVRDARESAY